MRSWQMFLSVCALPGIVGSVGLIFMPESPRFLMSSGRYAEALDVMRTIYAWNTGADKTAYPVTGFACIHRTQIIIIGEPIRSLN